MRIFLISAGQGLQGTVTTLGVRLLDLLNDRSTEYLKLADCVSMREWTQPEDARVLEHGAVLKSNVLAVVPLESEHEAPEKRAIYAVSRSRWNAFVTLPGHEVRGSVHLDRAMEPHEFQIRMDQEGRRFIAVTDAELTRLGAPGDPLKVPVAFVNRQQAGVLSLGAGAPASG